MKKIALIGTAGLPARYGGFETLADQLTSELVGRFDFRVYCSSLSRVCKPREHNRARLVHLPLKANGIQSIPYDILSMLHAAHFCDVLLVLGVSGCAFLPLLRLVSRKPVIVNIDGLEWRREKWSRPARLFLKFSERCAVSYADDIIADNAVIQDYVSREYGRPSHLIEYGGDHVCGMGITAELADDYPFLRDRYAVTVCRIEPENNIHVILEAFAAQSEIKLVVVGNWDQSAYGRELWNRYGTCASLRLLPPIYDRERLNVIRSNAFYCVHGHSAGGTNPSLVEAMHLGLPIAAYDVPYNRETTENTASYFTAPVDLARVIAHLGASHDLDQQRFAMKEIASRRYTWTRIAEKYASLFETRRPLTGGVGSQLRLFWRKTL